MGYKADGFSKGAYSICIEHLPNRKRPMLIGSINNIRFKLAEVTDEATLRMILSGVLGDTAFMDKTNRGE